MKRASYRAAVQWIADNDSAACSDALETGPVSELITTVLIADLFDVDSDRVARDVIRIRKAVAAHARVKRALYLAKVCTCGSGLGNGLCANCWPQ